MSNKSLRSVDPEVFEAIGAEITRQRDGLELIASENFCSAAVLAAMGSPLTNKYAEGYPGRRYYGGCDCVDTSETLAIERAKTLFGAEHANVQAHSGSQANMAAYFSLVKPGCTLLGLDLDHGGHLSHGLSVNFSGKLFNSKSYQVNPESQRIEIDEFQKTVEEHRPELVILGASAYPRTWDFKTMCEIAHDAGAKVVSDIAHVAGLIAAGEHPDCIPHADITTTTTHKTLRGPRGGMILCGEEHRKAVNRWIFPGLQGGPLEHVIAAKAVAFREAMQDSFKEYIRKVIANAKTLAATLTNNGVQIVSGGTDNHLMLLDLRPQDLTGKAAQAALEEAGITTNKNMIPGDPQKPTVTSGIRIGTPAMTTRGMDETEMKQIGTWIAEIVNSRFDSEIIRRTHGQVRELCAAHPLYPNLNLGSELIR